MIPTYKLSWRIGDIPDTLPGKQPFWDRPGIETDRSQVDSSLSLLFQYAAFIAASSQHSGDLLQALPIASCGMRLDDKAICPLADSMLPQQPKKLVQ